MKNILIARTFLSIVALSTLILCTANSFADGGTSSLTTLRANGHSCSENIRMGKEGVALLYLYASSPALQRLGGSTQKLTDFVTSIEKASDYDDPTLCNSIEIDPEETDAIKLAQSCAKDFPSLNQHACTYFLKRKILAHKILDFYGIEKEGDDSISRKLMGLAVGNGNTYNGMGFIIEQSIAQPLNSWKSCHVLVTYKEAEKTRAPFISTDVYIKAALKRANMVQSEIYVLGNIMKNAFRVKNEAGRITELDIARERYACESIQ